MHLVEPAIFGIMYYFNMIKLSECSNVASNNCKYYDGLLSTSKYALVFSSIGVPMRVIQIWATSTFDQHELDSITSNGFVQAAAFGDIAIQVISFLSLFVIFVVRGISDFIGDTPSLLLDLMFLGSSFFQLLGDLSFIAFIFGTQIVI